MQLLGQVPSSPRFAKVRGQSLPRLVVRPGASFNSGAAISAESSTKFSNNFLFDSAGVTLSVTSMFSLAAIAKAKNPNNTTLTTGEKTNLRNMADGLINTVDNIAFPRSFVSVPLYLQKLSLEQGVSADLIGRVASYLLLVLDGDVMKYSEVILKGFASSEATSSSQITISTQLFLRFVVQFLANARDHKYTLESLINLFNSSQPINLNGLGQASQVTQQTMSPEQFLAEFGQLAAKVAVLLRIIELSGQETLVPVDYIERGYCKNVSDPKYANVPNSQFIPRVACKDFMRPSDFCATCAPPPPVPVQYIPKWACKTLSNTASPEEISAGPNELVRRSSCENVVSEQVCPSCEACPPAPNCPTCEKCAACPPTPKTDSGFTLDKRKTGLLVLLAGGAGYFAWKKGLFKFL